MNKNDIYNLLESHGIIHEIYEHQAVFTVDEANTLSLPHPEAGAKNLFVRDDKKKNYYLITLRDEKRVNLKEFSAAHGTRKLSFASEEDLYAMLELRPGSVSPFGLLSDKNRAVKFFLDRDFYGGHICIHPCDNTASVYLSTDDLLDLLSEHGTAIEPADI